MVKKPWGNYEVLFEDGECKVKRLVIEPGHRLSLQYHRERKEYWVIVRGTAMLTYGESDLFMKVGSTLVIEKEMKHRAKNIGEGYLVIIEVQLGHCIEEDVVRVDDDYGRQG
jgi:mannose-6-phosphate isomerase-like protein (cupin superfamily)